MCVPDLEESAVPEASSKFDDDVSSSNQLAYVTFEVVAPHVRSRLAVLQQKQHNFQSIEIYLIY